MGDSIETGERNECWQVLAPQFYLWMPVTLESRPRAILVQEVETWVMTKHKRLLFDFDFDFDFDLDFHWSWNGEEKRDPIEIQQGKQCRCNLTEVLSLT